MEHKEPPLFTRWEMAMNWLLDTVEKFPKNSRFTVGQRIINVSLDIMELLIEARYAQKGKKEKIEYLHKINIALDKLRIFMRIAENRKYLSQKQIAFIFQELFEIGSLLGGWIKQQELQK